MKSLNAGVHEWGTSVCITNHGPAVGDKIRVDLRPQRSDKKKKDKLAQKQSARSSFASLAGNTLT